MRDIEKYTEDYSVQDFEVYQVEYRRRMIKEQVDKYQPHRILEIGCGKEPLFQYIRDKEWVIVEPSKVFCQIAESKKSNYDDVHILQGFFEEYVYQLKKESFDMIICSGLLNEVEEPGELLDGIFEICSERTIVHINVANAYSFHRILAKSMGNIADEHEKSERNKLFQQNMIFDIESIQEMVIRHQFEILDKGSFFIKPFTHKQMQVLLEKKIIDKKVLDGLYNMVHVLPMLGSEIYVNCRKICVLEGDRRCEIC